MLSMSNMNGLNVYVEQKTYQPPADVGLVFFRFFFCFFRCFSARTSSRKVPLFSTCLLTSDLLSSLACATVSPWSISFDVSCFAASLLRFDRPNDDLPRSSSSSSSSGTFAFVGPARGLLPACTIPNPAFPPLLDFPYNFARSFPSNCFRNLLLELRSCRLTSPSFGIVAPRPSLPHHQPPLYQVVIAVKDTILEQA